MIDKANDILDMTTKKKKKEKKRKKTRHAPFAKATG